MIKYIIFDFDGIIVDSEVLAARAFAEVLSQNSNSEEDINVAYKTFNFKSSDLLSVEAYLQEYFAT